MNNIKVTVEYETFKTGAFDSLVEQYEKSIIMAAQAYEYYAPLANVAEEEKAKAIFKQLETIKYYLCKIQKIELKPIEISAVETNCGRFYVNYFSKNNVEFKWHNNTFNVENIKKYPQYFNNKYHEKYNILGNWEKWRIFEKLENECLNKMKKLIEEQKKIAVEQRNRLINITKEED